VKIKPPYITIEDLKVRGMMKNKHLSKAIASQRIVDRFYPFFKLCRCCDQIKKDLKLSDHIYKCGCGYRADRDFNASLNLRDAKIYKIA